MPITTIRRLALTGAAGGAIALAGCGSGISAPTDPNATQPTPLSSISLTQRFCAGGANYVGVRDQEPCPPFQVFDSPASTNGAGRLLVAVAVPDGVADPTPVLRKKTDATFVQDPAVLAKLGTAPTGHRWVGYRSSTISYAPGEEDAGDDVIVRFAVPRPGGALSTDEISASIGVGVQVSENGNTATYDPDRAVDCSEQAGRNSFPDSTTCPTPDTTSTATIDATDALISPPEDPVEVQAGSSAAVPFVVQQVGTSPDVADLGLVAQIDADGATATPAVQSLPWKTPAAEEPPVPTTTDEAPPADTTDPRARVARAADPADASPTPEEPVQSVVETAVPVTVAVPASTPPGLYSVTLTGSDAGGERTATARLRVTAAPAQTGTTETPPTSAPAQTDTTQAPPTSAPGQTGTTQAPATPTTSAPATPVSPRKPISVTVKLLRSVQVGRRTRRLHLGQVTCVRDSGSCTVATKVRVGERTVGTLTVKVEAKATAGVTLRLSKANMERLIARPAVATTTITADGSDPVVRTTKVKAKRAANRP